MKRTGKQVCRNDSDCGRSLLVQTFVVTRERILFNSAKTEKIWIEINYLVEM